MTEQPHTSPGRLYVDVGGDLYRVMSLDRVSRRMVVSGRPDLGTIEYAEVKIMRDDEVTDARAALSRFVIKQHPARCCCERGLRYSS